MCLHLLFCQWSDMENEGLQSFATRPVLTQVVFANVVLSCKLPLLPDECQRKRP